MAGVRVAGVGQTHFGAYPDRTGRDLFAEAALAAREEAGVSREDFEALNYGNFVGTLAERQGHQGPLMAEAAGLECPATRFEEACASSGTAVRAAVQSIRSGEHDVLLVGGMERMHVMGTAGTTAGLATAADELFEVRAGITFPGAYALMARAYFERYGGDREDLAHIAVKNHQHALSNDHAQFQRAITVEEALDSPPVAEPLHLFDACPITDGASALVLVSDEYAETHDIDAPIAITGSGQGGDKMALQDRTYLAQTPAATKAAEQAYADAGRTPAEVDVAEVHDCFTIAEVLALESIGFYEPGEGIGAARRGENSADGDRPV
ncbi:MAG: thiolase C-terminal domain-containing protein, partial [Halobacteriota archaeon]